MSKDFRTKRELEVDCNNGDMILYLHAVIAISNFLLSENLCQLLVALL